MAIIQAIRRVWRLYLENPDAHHKSGALTTRLREIGKEIRRLPVTFDEWQIVYRQALQLGRLLDGEQQLLAAGSPTEASMRASTEPTAELASATGKASYSAARDLSTLELVADITAKVSLLARKEAELATTELKADLQRELTTVKALGAAIVAALLGFSTLLVAAVFALAKVMPGWLAALVVAGAVLTVAAVLGGIGWSHRVTRPLAMTRKTLSDDVQWAKEHIA
jgi:hypothetical protein